MRKAQTWSADALIAVSIFAVAFIFLFSFLSAKSQSDKISQLKKEGQGMPDTLSDALSSKSNATFIEGQKINKEKLERFANLTYDQLKDILGTSYNFCIHFEDEQGNIINVSNKTGIGSPKAKVGGVACS